MPSSRRCQELAAGADFEAFITFVRGVNPGQGFGASRQAVALTRLADGSV